jgi:hypothetical protein
MSFRAWLALLMFSNYLLMAGMGVIMRPDEPQNSLLLVQTTYENKNYQESRYLRMDGLEAFMMEALAERYQNAPQTPPHHLLSIVVAIDSHCLPGELRLHFILSVFENVGLTQASASLLSGVARFVYSPPWTK